MIMKSGDKSNFTLKILKIGKSKRSIQLRHLYLNFTISCCYLLGMTTATALLHPEIQLQLKNQNLGQLYQAISNLIAQENQCRLQGNYE